MAIFRTDSQCFGYRASLHVHHPVNSLMNLGDRIGINTRRFHNAGDPRRTPAGTWLPGVYPGNYWCGDLRTEDQEDITEFLQRLIADLLPHRSYLHELAVTGGEVCIFIGVGSYRCCDHQFDRQLLSDLAATGLDLRIGFYGSKLLQHGLHPNFDNAGS